MTHHLDDLQLVRRVLRGDEAAFDEFFGHYFPGLFRFAMARLGDESMAEEVAQQTLCVALHKLATYRGEAALFSWLCTFCRHEMSSLLRQAGRAPVPRGLADDLPQVRATLESLVDADFDRREVASWVRRVLDELPRRYGSALEWKYIDELSVRQIGERLGVSAKAAESVLSRARDAFRDALGSLDPDAANLLLGESGETS